MNKEFTIKRVLDAIEKKEFSAREITEFFIDKIEKKNKALNAYIFFDKEAVLEEAARVDKAGEKKLLAGVACAVKDNILIEGIQATASSKMLANYIASYSATSYQKIKKEGAVLLGKTNMDEFAMGSSTETSFFGATKNPYGKNRVPGGSSGGSAVAVASGMACFALGSDTGGSIRQPAAFCGVVGFKPTYGAVSRHGLMSMASSFDQIGTFTQTVEDAELVFFVLAGRDSFDATSSNFKFKKEISQNGRDIRLGVFSGHFSEGLDKGVRRRVEEAIDLYKKLGARVVEIDLPHTEYALAVYYILMCAEVSSNLARFDGFRYGFSKEADSVMDEYLERRSEAFGPEVKRRVMLGTYVLSSGYYDEYYGRAQKIQDMIKKDYDNAFKEVDAIICPTTPSPAFKIGEKTSDPLTMYLEDIYTVSANLGGLPAISFPCGFVEGQDGKLPVGAQLLGPRYSDSRLLSIADLFEKNFNNF